jgi:alanyl-tRNA synthetase
VKPELYNLDILEMPGLIAGYQELRAYTLRNESDTTKASTIPSAGAKVEERYTKKLMRENAELYESNIDSSSVMIPAELAFKLYDTYGLEESVIQELARVEGFEVDVNGFRHLLNIAKAQTKESFRSEGENELVQEIFNHCVKLGLDFTQDTQKYNYRKENNKYVFPSIECEVKAIFVNGKVVSKVGRDTHYSVVLDRTNFYHEAGGQASDTGQLVTNDGIQFHVTDVTNSGGYLMHHGYITKGTF